MNINVQMNPGFKEVDRSRKRYIVMKGSAGSGKSVDTAQNYILRLMQDPGRNLLCVRKADVTNRDSTFAELQGAIFRMFGEQYKRYWHINSSNMIMECSKYTQLGDIPSYAYQNFCEMYEAYHALGGNGMVTKMKQEIDELHIKKKGD